jgi:hypothetical protein
MAQHSDASRRILRLFAPNQSGWLLGVGRPPSDCSMNAFGVDHTNRNVLVIVV